MVSLLFIVLQVTCPFLKLFSYFIIKDHYDVHTLTTLSEGAPFLGDSIGTDGILEVPMEPLIPTLEVMAI